MGDIDKREQGEMAEKVVQMGATEIQMGEVPESEALSGADEVVKVGETTDASEVAGVDDVTKVGGAMAVDEDDGADEVAEVSGDASITEAEARAMLIEDNARAKEELKKAGSRGKKTLMIVIVLAVILITVGVVASVILGGLKLKGTNSDKQEGNSGGNAVVVERPEEEPGEPGTEVVELSLDDELVKELRHNFRKYRGIKGFGWLTFYDLAREGELSDEKILNHVMFNSVGTVECVGKASEEGWAEYCYDGQEVLEAAKRIFGREIEVYDGFVTGPCAETYDAENGIFIGNYRCGGSGPYYLQHDFVSAEKEGDKVYLYEVVVIWNEYSDFGEEKGYYKLASDEERAENEGKILDSKLAIDPNIWLAADADAGERYVFMELESRPLRDYAEQLDMFKWTFRKNTEGNYVFEGLERVK